MLTNGRWVCDFSNFVCFLLCGSAMKIDSKKISKKKRSLSIPLNKNSLFFAVMPVSSDTIFVWIWIDFPHLNERKIKKSSRNVSSRFLLRNSMKHKVVKCWIISFHGVPSNSFGQVLVGFNVRSLQSCPSLTASCVNAPHRTCAWKAMFHLNFT